jgi:hypothetical protein
MKKFASSDEKMRDFLGVVRKNLAGLVSLFRISS